MLSASRIKSASRATAYYGKDDYYVTGEADAPGLEWGGKSADALGLVGTASGPDFRKILEGTGFGAGEGPGPRREGAAHHPGWDFTFSAPKSVSVAILVGGDARLDRAHDRAVQAAMDYAERNLSYTRIRQNGQRREVLTGNLLYARTVHGVSREGDPQRHTHVIVANATRDPASGQWRALESLHLYRHRMLLGKIYQAELARDARELGFDVKKARAPGAFELAAWTREQLSVFAKRTDAIMRSLAIERPTSPAAREAVKLRGRPRKIDLQRSELIQRWKGEAEKAGLHPDRVVAAALTSGRGEDRSPRVIGRVSDTLSRLRSLAGTGTRGRDERKDPYGYLRAQTRLNTPAQQAVSLAIQAAEARSAVFSQHEVVERALDNARLGIGLGALEKEFARLERDGRLLAAGEGRFTTQRSLELEAGLVSRINAGRDTQAPVLTRAAVAESLWRLEDRAVRLNDGQRDAVATILCSTDRYVAIQGSAGVGKTTMFRAAKAVAAGAGWQLAAITPTHRAATAMIREAGVQTTTISAWALNMGRAVRSPHGLRQAREHWRKRALVIDEASMVSNDQMRTVLDFAERLGVSRVVMVGDDRQLGSPEAGAPFRLLLSRNIDQARMTEILRQKDPTLRHGVELLAQGKPTAAVRLIGDHIRQVGRGATDLQLAAAAVDAWREGRAAGREPQVVVPTNALRALVADLVRDSLRKEGQLQTEARAHEQYVHVRLDGPDRYRSSGYGLGDRLVFHRSVRGAGIRAGDEFDIIGLDKRNEILRVRTPLGDQSIDLSAHRRAGRLPFEAYKVRQAEVAEGERLVWERAQREKGRLTGAGFTVVGITPTHWTIQHDDGRREVLRADDPALRFTGYGYAETADRSQGQTYPAVVAVMSSRHGDAVTAARQYVMQSRPSEAFTMITDDRALLLTRLAKRDGLNPIASDAVEHAFDLAYERQRMTRHEITQGAGPSLGR